MTLAAVSRMIGRSANVSNVAPAKALRLSQVESGYVRRKMTADETQGGGVAMTDHGERDVSRFLSV
jgi:hypothetical protein